jgi:hypothetical protein
MAAALAALDMPSPSDAINAAIGADEIESARCPCPFRPVRVLRPR